MNNLYNQKDEIALRVLLLLNIIDEPKTLDVISTLDLIITYGKYFLLSDKNLHGENPYYLSEFTTRRTLIDEAIKFLVRNGLIDIKKSTAGFAYTISKKGLGFIAKTKTIYSKEYTEIAQKLKIQLNDYSDELIVEKVNFKKRK